MAPPRPNSGFGAESGVDAPDDVEPFPIYAPEDEEGFNRHLERLDNDPLLAWLMHDMGYKPLSRRRNFNLDPAANGSFWGGQQPPFRYRYNREDIAPTSWEEGLAAIEEFDWDQPLLDSQQSEEEQMLAEPVPIPVHAIPSNEARSGQLNLYRSPRKEVLTGKNYDQNDINDSLNTASPGYKSFSNCDREEASPDRETFDGDVEMLYSHPEIAAEVHAPAEAMTKQSIHTFQKRNVTGAHQAPIKRQKNDSGACTPPRLGSKGPSGTLFMTPDRVIRSSSTPSESSYTTPPETARVQDTHRHTDTHNVGELAARTEDLLLGRRSRHQPSSFVHYDRPSVIYTGETQAAIGDVHMDEPINAEDADVRNRTPVRTPVRPPVSPITPFTYDRFMGFRPLGEIIADDTSMRKATSPYESRETGRNGEIGKFGQVVEDTVMSSYGPKTRGIPFKLKTESKLRDLDSPIPGDDGAITAVKNGLSAVKGPVSPSTSAVEEAKAWDGYVKMADPTAKLTGDSPKAKKDDLVAESLDVSSAPMDWTPSLPGREDGLRGHESPTDRPLLPGITEYAAAASSSSTIAPSSPDKVPAESSSRWPGGLVDQEPELPPLPYHPTKYDGLNTLPSPDHPAYNVDRPDSAVSTEPPAKVIPKKRSQPIKSRKALTAETASEYKAGEDSESAPDVLVKKKSKTSGPAKAADNSHGFQAPALASRRKSCTKATVDAEQAEDQQDVNDTAAAAPENRASSQRPRYWALETNYGKRVTRGDVQTAARDGRTQADTQGLPSQEQRKVAIGTRKEDEDFVDDAENESDSTTETVEPASKSKSKTKTKATTAKATPKSKASAAPKTASTNKAVPRTRRGRASASTPASTPASASASASENPADIVNPNTKRNKYGFKPLKRNSLAANTDASANGDTAESTPTQTTRQTRRAHAEQEERERQLEIDNNVAKRTRGARKSMQ